MTPTKVQQDPVSAPVVEASVPTNQPAPKAPVKKERKPKVKKEKPPMPVREISIGHPVTVDGMVIEDYVANP